MPWSPRGARSPPTSGPELILFGQSLGSLGTQGAWTADATPEDVVSEIPHVIWMGPPAESVLWKAWQANRTGGPAWEPIVGDGTITRVLVSQDDPDAARAEAGRRPSSSRRTRTTRSCTGAPTCC